MFNSKTEEYLAAYAEEHGDYPTWIWTLECEALDDLYDPEDDSEYMEQRYEIELMYLEHLRAA